MARRLRAGAGRAPLWIATGNVGKIAVLVSDEHATWLYASDVRGGRGLQFEPEVDRGHGAIRGLVAPGAVDVRAVSRAGTRAVRVERDGSFQLLFDRTTSAAPRTLEWRQHGRLVRLDLPLPPELARS